MIAKILSMAAPMVLWMISNFLKSSAKKEKAKKDYLSYIDYWQANRETPSDISDDVDALIAKANKDINEKN